MMLENKANVLEDEELAEVNGGVFMVFQEAVGLLNNAESKLMSVSQDLNSNQSELLLDATNEIRNATNNVNNLAGAMGMIANVKPAVMDNVDKLNMMLKK